MPEEIPFDNDCRRCEYDRDRCKIALKVSNKIARKFRELEYRLFSSRWITDGLRCRQGRKVKVIRQSTIAEILEKHAGKVTPE